MKKQEAKQRFQELQLKQELEAFESNLNRSRSISVGTSFGGSTEISMRGDNKYLWCVLQPVEVVELIHQLSANIGCHIAIKPRDDFSSWREWRISEAEKKHLNGHPPFVNDMAVFQRLGAIGFDQEKAESLMEEWLVQKEYEYVNGGANTKKELKNETMAIEKNIDKRKSKRTTATTK